MIAISVRSGHQQTLRCWVFDGASMADSAQTQAAVRHVEKQVPSWTFGRLWYPLISSPGSGFSPHFSNVSDSGGIGGRWEDLFEVLYGLKGTDPCHTFSTSIGCWIQVSSQTFHHRDSKLNPWHCVVSDKELFASTHYAFSVRGDT